jgi:hypothetical protein
MTDKEVEELMKACEAQVGELLYVTAGKNFKVSAELLEDMAERLYAQARADRERARKRPGKAIR